MTRRKAALFVALAVMGSLLLTACAGIATGQISMPRVAGPIAFDPGVSQLDSVSIELGSSAVREMTWTALRADRAEPEQAAVAVLPANQAMTAVQSTAALLADGDAFPCHAGH